MRAVASQQQPMANKPPRRQRPLRRVRAAEEAHVSLTVPIANWQAKLGWRCACWGLLPIGGLLFGMAALLFGGVGLLRVTRRPEDLGIRHAVGAMILGSLEILFNAAGIASVLIGLRALHVW